MPVLDKNVRARMPRRRKNTKPVGTHISGQCCCRMFLCEEGEIERWLGAAMGGKGVSWRGRKPVSGLGIFHTM